MKSKTINLGVLAVLFLLSVNTSFSQYTSDETKNPCISKNDEVSALEPMSHNHNEEINPQVPALSDYHEVIYQIWHNGWPNKDYELLKSLYPEAEKGFNNLTQVKMTGILQDKQAKWDDGVKQLGKYLQDYKTAIDKNDNKALLDAAEKLHSQYEQLVRLIRPVIKELDEFHKVLYVLYHYDYPDYNYEEIKQDVAELSKKMNELNATQLPERMESLQKKFEKRRADLSSAIKNLENTVNLGNNKDAISKAIEEVHSKYQSLESVFD
jgi:hypothetical protein